MRGTTKIVPGEYEVSFTKKGAETETAVFVVRAAKTPTIECTGLANGTFVVGVGSGAVVGGTATLPAGKVGAGAIAAGDIPH